MGVVTFNNITSSSLNAQVEHPPEYEIAERDYNIIPVPGRNGDVSIDNGRYKNVDRSYQIAIGSVNGNFTALAHSIADWLHSANGYVRLEDSYEPDYYKMAMYTESNSIANILQQAGRATITFNRKPQRYLKTGDTLIIPPSGSIYTITNPTINTSLPILTILGTGNGTVTIAGYTITITGLISSITINSEIEEAYNGSTNMNMYATLPNGFPQLKPGNNSISYSGGITSVKVQPKWWTL